MDRELYIILALCTQTGGKVLYNDKDVNWEDSDRGQWESKEPCKYDRDSIKPCIK